MPNLCRSRSGCERGEQEFPHGLRELFKTHGCGDPSVERLAAVFRGVCRAAMEDDGLAFDPATVTAGRIKEDQEYEGVRVGCFARLGQARIDLQVDVGFGDAVTPAPVTIRYPGRLDFPTAELAAYPRETAVAEKFQAMVALGIANSRMKDFFDVWVLARIPCPPRRYWAKKQHGKPTRCRPGATDRHQPETGGMAVVGTRAGRPPRPGPRHHRPNAVTAG